MYMYQFYSQHLSIQIQNKNNGRELSSQVGNRELKQRRRQRQRER